MLQQITFAQMDPTCFERNLSNFIEKNKYFCFNFFAGVGGQDGWTIVLADVIICHVFSDLK